MSIIMTGNNHENLIKSETQPIFRNISDGPIPLLTINSCSLFIVNMSIEHTNIIKRNEKIYFPTNIYLINSKPHYTNENPIISNETLYNNYVSLIKVCHTDFDSYLYIDRITSEIAQRSLSTMKNSAMKCISNVNNVISKNKYIIEKYNLENIDLDLTNTKYEIFRTSKEIDLFLSQLKKNDLNLFIISQSLKLFPVDHEVEKLKDILVVDKGEIYKLVSPKVLKQNIPCPVSSKCNDLKKKIITRSEKYCTHKNRYDIVNKKNINKGFLKENQNKLKILTLASLSKKNNNLVKYFKNVCTNTKRGLKKSNIPKKQYCKNKKYTFIPCNLKKSIYSKISKEIIKEEKTSPDKHNESINKIEVPTKTQINSYQNNKTKCDKILASKHHLNLNISESEPNNKNPYILYRECDELIFGEKCIFDQESQKSKNNKIVKFDKEKSKISHAERNLLNKTLIMKKPRESVSFIVEKDITEVYQIKTRCLPIKPNFELYDNNVKKDEIFENMTDHKNRQRCTSELKRQLKNIQDIVVRKKRSNSLPKELKKCKQGKKTTKYEDVENTKLYKLNKPTSKNLLVNYQKTTSQKKSTHSKVDLSNYRFNGQISGNDIDIPKGGKPHVDILIKNKRKTQLFKNNVPSNSKSLKLYNQLNQNCTNCDDKYSLQKETQIHYEKDEKKKLLTNREGVSKNFTKFHPINDSNIRNSQKRKISQGYHRELVINNNINLKPMFYHTKYTKNVTKMKPVDHYNKFHNKFKQDILRAQSRMKSDIKKSKNQIKKDIEFKTKTKINSSLQLNSVNMHTDKKLRYPSNQYQSTSKNCFCEVRRLHKNFNLSQTSDDLFYQEKLKNARVLREENKNTPIFLKNDKARQKYITLDKNKVSKKKKYNLNVNNKFNSNLIENRPVSTQELKNITPIENDISLKGLQTSLVIDQYLLKYV